MKQAIHPMKSPPYMNIALETRTRIFVRLTGLTVLSNGFALRHVTNIRNDIFLGLRDDISQKTNL